MKLVADECVDKPIVYYLRSLGYEIIYILEISPGCPDKEVLKLANKEQAVLLTTDTDFGELVYRLKETTYGIVLLRLAGLNKEQKNQLIGPAIGDHIKEIAGSFSVITKDSIRIRKL